MVVEMRAPVRVVHDEGSAATFLVPDDKRAADRAAGITGRRLHIDLLERRHASHFAVGDGIHRAAPGKRNGRQIGMALVEQVQKIEECLLIHGLRRAGDVTMAILEGIRRRAAGPKQAFKRWRKEIAELGRSAAPFERDSLLVVAKEM